MRVGRAFRRAVMDRIIAEVDDLQERVFDKATEETVFPYCTLGPSYWSAANRECITARALTLQIDIWHRQSNKGALEDLLDDTAAALAGWQPQLAGSPINVSLARAMDDPDGVSVHGILQIEAVLEDGNA